MHYSLGNSFYNKRVFYIASIVVIILLIIIGIVRRGKNQEVYSEPGVTAEPTETASSAGQSDIPTISVYNHDENMRQEMSIEDYVIHSVAGEMPASFDMEALKAQAIACRTLAYTKQGKGEGCYGCDICTDSSHGQGYLTEANMYKIWENDYEKWLTIIKESVSSTAGEIITYSGEAIEVMYHACSDGRTEASGNVFVSDKPYLVSVSSYDEGIVQDKVGYTLSEFISIINNAYPKANLMLNTAEDNINIISHTESGRVESICLGDVTLTGRNFRELFQLKSSDFDITISSMVVNITTRGYGHGVGMSQRGANEMAKSGYNCYDILTHYYTGTEIKTIY